MRCTYRLCRYPNPAQSLELAGFLFVHRAHRPIQGACRSWRYPTLGQPRDPVGFPVERAARHRERRTFRTWKYRNPALQVPVDFWPALGSRRLMAHERPSWKQSLREHSADGGSPLARQKRRSKQRISQKWQSMRHEARQPKRAIRGRPMAAARYLCGRRRRPRRSTRYGTRRLKPLSPTLRVTRRTWRRPTPTRPWAPDEPRPACRATSRPLACQTRRWTPDELRPLKQSVQTERSTPKDSFASRFQRLTQREQ
jgi:hypothetical protein